MEIENQEDKKIVHFVVSATGYYLKWVNDFLKHCHNMLGNDNYTYRITLICDKCSNEWKTVREEIVNTINNTYYNILECEVVSCPDFPWPVITLYKPYLCKKYIKDDDSVVWCGNINIEMEENDGSWYSDNKINISWHHKHPEPYFNTKPYYVQGGFVCGEKNIMKWFLGKWQSIINYCINNKHIVPEWHDETCLNLLFKNNKELFNPNFIFWCEEKYGGLGRIDGAFAKLNLDGKVDDTFKSNWDKSENYDF